MTNVLAPVQVFLTPHVRAAGFKATDRARWQNLGWLGYRAADAAGTVLLDIFHTPAQRTITAELWRPARLPEALRADAPGSAAERRQAWYYGRHADPYQLGREVAEAVAGWLPGPRGDGARPATGSPTPERRRSSIPLGEHR